MVQLIASGGMALFLGKQGENLATEIVFPLAQWIAVYGEGTAVLAVQRNGDAGAYPVELRRNGNNAYWAVTSADTAVSGCGQCELRWYVGQTLVKSAIYRTVTEAALDGEAEPPQPWQSWVDRVISATGHNPFPGENGHWMVWDDEGQLYTDSGIAVTGQKGDKGDPGEKGEKGDKGDKGEKGEPGVISAATADTLGGVKVSAAENIGIVFTADKQLRIAPATQTQLNSRNSNGLTTGQEAAIKYKPITAGVLDAAVKASLDENPNINEALQASPFARASKSVRKYLGLEEKADRRGCVVFTADKMRHWYPIAETNTDYIAADEPDTELYPDGISISFMTPEDIPEPIYAQDGDTVNICFKTGADAPAVYLDGGNVTVIGDTPAGNSYVEYNMRCFGGRWIAVCRCIPM